METRNKLDYSEDKVTDISYYVMFGTLIFGFILTLGYIVYTFFE